VKPGPREVVETPFEAFLEASARLTGFGRAELLGTGSAGLYWDTVRQNAPAEAVTAMLAGRESAADAAVIELWYLGLWRGVMGTDNRIVSARAYREGLVWGLFGGHPMGAKQQGYGAWSLPPEGS
jgi:hypothetical protein